MKLNEYIKNLQELQKKGCGNYPLVYSIDDEGNAFKQVVFAPSLGVSDGNYFNASEYGNCICIN